MPDSNPSENRSGVTVPVHFGLYSRIISKLARVTSSGRYIGELDGLRFVAISTVFIQHVQQVVVSRLSSASLDVDLLGRLVRDYRIGVELFFLISGFILGLPFADQYLRGRRKVSLKAYYWRRITRLEPPYLASLFLCTVSLILLNGHTFRGVFPNLLASAFYSHNVAYSQFSLINSVAWSLEIEVQFYCLAPILAHLFRIPGRALRRFIIVCLAIGVFFFRHWLERYYLLPPNLLMYLHYFLLGIILADVYLVDWQEAPSHSLWWDIFAIPGWILLPFLFYRKIPAQSLVVGSALFFLVWATFRSRLCRAVLRWSPLSTIGGMCYTIYLLHHAILWDAAPLLRPTTGSLIWLTMKYSALLTLVVLPISIVFFLAIEKPCMRKDWPIRLARLVGDKLLRHRSDVTSIE